MAEIIKKDSPEDYVNNSTLSMESFVVDHIPNDRSSLDSSDDISERCHTNGLHGMSDLPESPIKKQNEVDEYCASNGFEKDECSLDEAEIDKYDYSNEFEKDECSLDEAEIDKDDYSNEFEKQSLGYDESNEHKSNYSLDGSEVDGHGSYEYEEDKVESQQRGIETVEDVVNSPSDIADTESVDAEGGSSSDIAGTKTVDTEEKSTPDIADKENVDTKGESSSDVADTEPVDTEENSPSDITDSETVETDAKSTSDIADIEPVDRGGKSPSDIADTETVDTEGKSTSDIADTETVDTEGKSISDIADTKTVDTEGKSTSDIADTETVDTEGESILDIADTETVDTEGKSTSDIADIEPVDREGKSPSDIADTETVDTEEQSTSDITDTETVDTDGKSPSDIADTELEDRGGKSISDIADSKTVDTEETSTSDIADREPIDRKEKSTSYIADTEPVDTEGKSISDIADTEPVNTDGISPSAIADSETVDRGKSTPDIADAEPVDTEGKSISDIADTEPVNTDGISPSAIADSETVDRGKSTPDIADAEPVDTEGKSISDIADTEPLNTDGISPSFIADSDTVDRGKSTPDIADAEPVDTEGKSISDIADTEPVNTDGISPSVIADSDTVDRGKSTPDIADAEPVDTEGKSISDIADSDTVDRGGKSTPDIADAEPVDTAILSEANLRKDKEIDSEAMPTTVDNMDDIATITDAIGSSVSAEHVDNSSDVNDDESQRIQSTDKRSPIENESHEEQTRIESFNDESLSEKMGSDTAITSRSESAQRQGADSYHDASSSMVVAEIPKDQRGPINSRPVEKSVVNISVEKKTNDISSYDSQHVDLQPVPDGQPLDLLLIGLTGHGKTSICKTILDSTDTSAKRTTECLLTETLVGGRQLRFLDTPGTIDNKNSEVALKEVANIFALNPSGFHAILFVIKYGSKISADELSLSGMLKALLGDDVFSDYVILVVTHGDRFKEDTMKGIVSGDVKAYANQEDCGLKDLLVECRQRVILFDGTELDPVNNRKQICHLVLMVDEIVNNNGGKRFDNSYFKLARKETELHTSTTVTDTETAEDKRALERSITEQVGHAVAQQIRKDNSWCFPADAFACLSSGKYVRMANLRVGDKVLSCARGGTLVFSEVYILGHAENDVKLPCVKICTSKSYICLSPGHYVFVSGETDSVMTPVSAQNVKCGDKVYICRSAHESADQSESMELETVIDIQSTICRGMYAPFTETGTIVVNGVLASCYVDLLPASVSHLMLWPVRKLYEVCPGLCSILSYGRFDGIPLWMHWCVKTLLPVLPFRYFRQ